MNVRHEQNSNLRLIEGYEWAGLPLQSSQGPFVESYLQRLHETIKASVDEHRRVTAIRVDLRFPAIEDSDHPTCFFYHDSSVISRFLSSLESQFDADEKRKRQMGIRVRHAGMRYVWVKEQDSALLPHYHVLLLLNADVYHYLGNFHNAVPEHANTATRICKAWARATRLPFEQAAYLVNFPTDGVYHINANSVELFSQMASLFGRACYLAKARTKNFGGGLHSFGCSRTSGSVKKYLGAFDM